MQNDNFYSIDRLVEFGMSMSIAQQMVRTMNESISNNYVSGVNSQINQPVQQIYFVMLNGKQAGPFSESELSRLITDKKIGRESFVWKPGMAKWDLAENIPEILKIVALAPPPFNN